MATVVLDKRFDSGQIRAMSFANQTLVIAGRSFRSRLILGTGKFSAPETMRDALAASGANWSRSRCAALI